MNQVRKFLTKLWSGLDSPLKPVLMGHLEKEEWKDLQKIRVEPTAYRCAMAYRRDAFSVEIIRKLLLPGDTASRKKAAIDTFWAAEKQCALTNARLDRYLHEGPYDTADLPIHDFISRWKKEIKRVLGSSCKGLPLEPDYSPGSTLSDTGKNTTIPDKMSSTLTYYPQSVNELVWFTHTPHAENPMKVQRANRFFTVPKDSQKDRGCCVEASANIILQKCVGKQIRNCYNKAYQADLQNDQRKHQLLAQRGSAGLIDVCTIDLSNASDTISWKLVKMLLPSRWWRLLNSLRAGFTEIEGKIVKLEKFSSMGNGFTFELETLLFRSLIKVTCPSEFDSTYGDDMICGSECAKALEKVLPFFGFTINEKKSFREGPFRESCGGDFFDGVPVRAHYLKEIPDEPQKWIALANGVRCINNGDLDAAWWYCIDQIPVQYRVFGPEILGDIVIHQDDPQPVVRPFVTKERVFDQSASPPQWRTVKTVNMLPQYRVYAPIGKTFSVIKHFSHRYDVIMATLALGLSISELD